MICEESTPTLNAWGQEEEKEYRVIRQVIRNFNINKTPQNECTHTHTHTHTQFFRCLSMYVCIYYIEHMHLSPLSQEIKSIKV